MAKQAKEQETVTIDQDLGITLDFGNNEEIEDSLILDNPPTKDTDESVEEDLFKTPEGVTGSDGEIDINAEFEKLINTSDTPEQVVTKPAEGKKESTSTNANKQKETNEVSDSLTVAFAKTLLELQGLSDFKEDEYKALVKEKGEAAAFIELMENEATKKVENYRKSIDGYAQEYTQLREVGFTKEEASTIVGNKETINAISEDQLKEDEELQIDVVREVGKLKGEAEEEIEENIQLLKETDKLATRAKANLVQLKNYYSKVAEQELVKKREEIKAKDQSQVEFLKSLKTDIDTTEEILKDKKINQPTKDKIYSMLTTPIKQEDGTVLNEVWTKRKADPKAFDKKLAYFIHIGLFDGKVDSLVKDSKTKAASELQKLLDGGRVHTSGDPIVHDERVNDRVNAMKDFLD